MDPTPEEAAEGSILVKVLAAVLERLVNSNTVTARTDPGQVTKFHALKAPGIGVEAYLDRIHKYASCSNECFILALIYIDRLIERNNFLLTELNVHRVVITAILLAAKFFDDAYYNNAYYAKVGGVLVSELNGLEVDFLFRINFSLHVQPEVFEKYKAELVAHSINSGLIPPQLASPVGMSNALSNIPETEAGSSGNDMTSNVTAAQHNGSQEQYTTMHGGPTAGAVNYDAMVVARTQVTPSPTNASQELADMGNASMNISVSMQEPSYVAEQQRAQEPVHQPQTDGHTISATGTHNNTTTFHTFEPAIQTVQIMLSDEQDIEQQHQPTVLLQRAQSLPPFSSVRCVDHAFKLPYSAPPMPTTAPIMNVDPMNYQVMMNQLFPIETTLVHHNHQSSDAAIPTSTTIANHPTHPAGGLVGHHPGGGLAHMAYEVAFSG
mmetsp:Transcript_4424/g.10692  ORF Transcript_4424/g.10692 Transcript_4424/m.10692 type:complete len:437 (+) Transcript_4424:519-1829(+)